MGNVIIWGAGDTAQIFLNSIDLKQNKIVAFVDNDQTKWGSYSDFMLTIPIISPNVIQSILYDVLLVCSFYVDDIMRQCREMKLQHVYSYLDLNVFNDYPMLGNRELIKGYSYDDIWRRCTLLAVRQVIQPVIDAFGNYCNEKNPLGEMNSSRSYNIWSCWWQGEERAPILVTKCFESIRNKIEDKNIDMIVITKDNWQEYVEIPQYILTKVDAGIITLTHLSDIIRIKLLAKYGGLWLDATIYCPYGFDMRVFQNDFFSIKEENIYNSSHIIPHAYKFFLMKTNRANILLEFLDIAAMYYWKNKKSLLIFHLFVYMVRIIYDIFPDIKNMIDTVPVNNIEIETLNLKMDEPFNRAEWERMNESTHFFKLSNRREYKEFDADGQMTFYGFFIRNLI